jgi:hypothetical protein
MELTARRKEGEYIADLARSVVCRSLRIRAATATAISLMPARQILRGTYTRSGIGCRRAHTYRRP